MKPKTVFKKDRNVTENEFDKGALFAENIIPLLDDTSYLQGKYSEFTLLTARRGHFKNLTTPQRKLDLFNSVYGKQTDLIIIPDMKVVTVT